MELEWELEWELEQEQELELEQERELELEQEQELERERELSRKHTTINYLHMTQAMQKTPALFEGGNQPQQKLATIDAASTRAAQEVQAAMVIAKKFQRDEFDAIERIKRACKRQSLAEVACYAYPRAGTTVTGPSIRLAECIAQNWGNVDSGVVELEQRDGESSVMAYAWDLETNTRSTKVFQVKHERKAQGKIKRLDDPRDIYEMVANQGSRRLRACILATIPGDVVELAVAECEKTLKGGKEPLVDRVRKMVSVFGEQGVTAEQIAQRLGHKLEVTTEQELVNLRKIFTSIRDGMAKAGDFFGPPVKSPDFGDQGEKEQFLPPAPEKPADPPRAQEPPPAKKKGRPAGSKNKPKPAEPTSELSVYEQFAVWMDGCAPPINWGDVRAWMKQHPEILPAERAKDTLDQMHEQDVAFLLKNREGLGKQIGHMRKAKAAEAEEDNVPGM